MTEDITPEILLTAYAQGYFPMAQAADDEEIYWFNPEHRGIISLDGGFKINDSNQRLLISHRYSLTVNKAFRAVMEGCRENRDGCWISDKIIDLYCQVHEMGFASSIECWEADKLQGGLYGIHLGGAFFGESMFSRQSGASKIALISLVGALREAGYQLLDAQYVNDHLKQFGVVEISSESYLERLKSALKVVPKKLDISIG